MQNIDLLLCSNIGNVKRVTKATNSVITDIKQS